MRKLVAGLTVRNNGQRLYAKPLQNISKGVTILDQIINTIKCFNEIKEVVIGIAEGSENLCYIDFCNKRKLKFVTGDEKDMLQRLIKCGEKSEATDIFRVSTECPFLWMDEFKNMWIDHINNGNDITVTDNLPEGPSVEVYKLSTLKYIYKNCDEKYKSEIFSRYPRNNVNKFKVQVIEPPQSLRRTDIRLTVDYPEDLTLCRIIFEKFKDSAPNIKIKNIINYLDDSNEIKNIVKKRVDSSQTLAWQAFKE